VSSFTGVFSPGPNSLPSGGKLPCHLHYGQAKPGQLQDIGDLMYLFFDGAAAGCAKLFCAANSKINNADRLISYQRKLK